MQSTVSSVVVDRYGAALDQAATVHFSENSVIGILPYATGPSELLNTAVISGTAVESGIVSAGIRKRGEISDVTSQSTFVSSNDRVLHVTGRSATLDGTEETGAANVQVEVAYEAFHAVVPFRIHFPVAASLVLSTAQLRPVAGCYADLATDGSCAQQLRYPPARVRTSLMGSQRYSTTMM
jgi:hypothetical protein